VSKICSERFHGIKLRTTAAALIGAALLGACVELPNAPTVPVMPSPYKPFEVFQADDQVCRGFAYQQIGGGPNGTTSSSYDDRYSYYGLQYQYNIAYQQCMYSRGNQISGFSAPTSPPGPPPAASAPAPTPVPPAAAK